MAILVPVEYILITDQQGNRELGRVVAMLPISNSTTEVQIKTFLQLELLLYPATYITELRSLRGFCTLSKSNGRVNGRWHYSGLFEYPSLRH